MTALPFVAILVKSHESAAEMSCVSARLPSDLSVQVRLLSCSQLQDVESVCFSFRLNNLQCSEKKNDEQKRRCCRSVMLSRRIPFNNCVRRRFLISHLLLRDGEGRDQPCCSHHSQRVANGTEMYRPDVFHLLPTAVCFGAANTHLILI